MIQIRKVTLYILVALIILISAGCNNTNIEPILTESDVIKIIPNTALKADDSIGKDVKLDYADESIVIFHGWFGLFIYDIKHEELSCDIDLQATIGCNTINDDEIIEVKVSSSGKTVMLYIKSGTEPEEAFYYDVASGALTRDKYKPLPEPFNNFAYVSWLEQGSGEGFSDKAVKFENGYGWISSRESSNLGGLIYQRMYSDGNSIICELFKGYFNNTI